MDAALRELQAAVQFALGELRKAKDERRILRARLTRSGDDGTERALVQLELDIREMTIVEFEHRVRGFKARMARQKAEAMLCTFHRKVVMPTDADLTKIRGEVGQVFQAEITDANELINATEPG
jgi:hypothetical protein